MDVLDDTMYRERLDSQNMLRPIRELPMQIQCAWQQVHESVELPTLHPANVVILGMGGSAIGGDIARSLVAEHSPIPIIVHRDYGVPACVDKHSLVIAVSYSGNTEETLSGFDAAVERGAHVFAIAAGGELIDRASKHGVPYYKFDYETQPRAALGYLLTPILAIFNSVGIYSIDDSLISEAVRCMHEEQRHWDADTPTESNSAKQLAHTLAGYIPVVCASQPLTVVARRWKTQFNENANCACFFEELPELCHNMVVGFDYPDELSKR
ncbi:MAG TPA: SIS domain-containing protein, partial [Armatimonadetes bacterium]|nr:SIS domain-containing protein [Armatimonadota bacterium]